METKMDAVTAGVILGAVAHAETEDQQNKIHDLVKELKSGGGNPPSPEQIAWFVKNEGRKVSVANGYLIGRVESLNKATHGLYEGGRYPIYVRILDVEENNPKARNQLFEYDLDQLEVIEE